MRHGLCIRLFAFAFAVEVAVAVAFALAFGPAERPPSLEAQHCQPVPSLKWGRLELSASGRRAKFAGLARANTSEHNVCCPLLWPKRQATIRGGQPLVGFAETFYR